MKESNENIATNVCCLASSFVCRSLKGTLSLEVKDVEGQRSHVHCWHMWEPGSKADLAGAKCFSLITPSPNGFAFWMPPHKETAQSGDDIVRNVCRAGNT